MVVKIWCLATLVLAALLMGTSFAHALEMPAKMRYDTDEWMHAQHTLYFAYARIGGMIEIAAILAAGALATFLHDWRPAMLTAVAGAAMDVVGATYPFKKQPIAFLVNHVGKPDEYEVNGLGCVKIRGMGIGFTIMLLAMGAIREVLGSGSFLGVPVMGRNFEPWVIMVLPPGGFLTLGIIMLAIAWWRERGVRRAAAPRGAR